MLESGRAEIAPNTAAVKDSITALKDALAALKENPSAAELAIVKPSLRAVQTTVQNLITALDCTC